MLIWCSQGSWTVCMMGLWSMWNSGVILLYRCRVLWSGHCASLCHWEWRSELFYFLGVRCYRAIAVCSWTVCFEGVFSWQVSAIASKVSRPLQWCCASARNVKVWCSRRSALCVLEMLGSSVRGSRRELAPHLDPWCHKEVPTNSRVWLTRGQNSATRLKFKTSGESSWNSSLPERNWDVPDVQEDECIITRLTRFSPKPGQPNLRSLIRMCSPLKLRSTLKLVGKHIHSFNVHLRFLRTSVRTCLMLNVKFSNAKLRSTGKWLDTLDLPPCYHGCILQTSREEGLHVKFEKRVPQECLARVRKSVKSVRQKHIKRGSHESVAEGRPAAQQNCWRMVAQCQQECHARVLQSAH